MNRYNQDNFDEHLNELIKKIFKRKEYLGFIFLLIFFFIGSFSSFYTVQPDEEAVILRFGKYINTTLPGLHFKIPFGIDKAIKVKTKRLLQEEFGFRTRKVSGTRTSYDESSDFEDESLMLTGDLNIANVEWITQFRISDPKKFLFETRDPFMNVRDISEAVMRRLVGDRLVTEVLTIGKSEIENQAKQLMQEIINRYDMGINIVSFLLQDVNPPKSVRPSFNEVNSAKQEQEKSINQAESEYNKVIPEARGKAQEEISKAEGYANALVNRSLGDANRFSLVLKEYRKAPDVTRKRLYLETMEKLLKNLDSIIIIDSNVKGLLPIFNKNKL